MHEAYISKAKRLIYRSYSRSFSQINHQSSYSSSLFETVNLDKTIESLKENGFSLGINLPKCVVQEILKFAMHTPCYGNKNSNQSFYYPEKEQAQAKYEQHFFIGNYDNTDLHFPVIQKLVSDPILLEITAKYLKAEPVHQENRLWWSFPVESSIYERRREAQTFHYSRNESRLLKFSFYITDVNLCSSPHVCVRGSHVKKKLSHRLLYGELSYKEIYKYYGYKNIVPICGKAGFGFVEDTLCFHKETPPGSQERLTLEVMFSDR